MFAFFQRLAPTVIAIEACSASHHSARLLQSFGHTVKLIAPQQLAAVALANKMARIAWKLMVTGENYAVKSAPAALEAQPRVGQTREQLNPTVLSRCQNLQDEQMV